jgi:hypothetical protein
MYLFADIIAVLFLGVVEIEVGVVLEGAVLLPVRLLDLVVEYDFVDG